MRTVSFQGTRLTTGDRARLEQSRRISVQRSALDWDALRQTINSKMFVGPRQPVVVSHEENSDWYWKLVNNFCKYGRVDYEAHGTPCVSDTFGF